MGVGVGTRGLIGGRCIRRKKPPITLDPNLHLKQLGGLWNSPRPILTLHQPYLH